MKVRNPKPKDEFLGRYGPSRDASWSLKLPGYDGPRPKINIVIEILAGRVKGIVEALLPFETQVRYEPDTLGQLLAEADSIPLIQSEMVSTMRVLAGLWIDSGKDAANPGIDAPAKRNVEFARSEDSPSIHQLLRIRLFDRHPRYVKITLKGKLGVSDTFPHLEPRLGTSHYSRDSLANYGDRLALFFFAQFLDSPYSLHLNRCDDCGSYFAYERARLVRVKNGVHCDRCKVSDSVKRTKSRRHQLTNEMVSAAATAFIEWKKSNKNPDQRAWILTQVNNNFSRVLKRHKTKRWLTEHWDRIVETVERRKNAKGLRNGMESFSGQTAPDGGFRMWTRRESAGSARLRRTPGNRP